MGLRYDAENRQIQATSTSTGETGYYLYDGAGRRVEKTLPAGNTIYVYDAFGRLSAEYSTATVPAPCATCCLSKEHLGSTRLVTNQSGDVVGRHDFAPFGQEVPSGYAGRNSQFEAGDTVNQLFTGQERDPETGLDYFGARYLASGLGRFLSPDPANAGAALTHPQSWNAYAYVGNNPLKATDPSGMFEVGDDEDGGAATTLSPESISEAVLQIVPPKSGTKTCASGSNGGAIWTGTSTFPLLGPVH